MCLDLFQLTFILFTQWFILEILKNILVPLYLHNKLSIVFYKAQVGRFLLPKEESW